MGTARLTRTWDQLGAPEIAAAMFEKEKEGWDLYYDLLDELEKGLVGNDSFAKVMREQARKLVAGWRVECESGKDESQ
jgi:hypothetical protein